MLVKLLPFRQLHSQRQPQGFILTHYPQYLRISHHISSASCVIMELNIVCSNLSSLEFERSSFILSYVMTIKHYVCFLSLFCLKPYFSVMVLQQYNCVTLCVQCTVAKRRFKPLFCCCT